MPNKYYSINDLKAIAGATTPAQDVYLQQALDWAEGEFEGMAGKQFDSQAVTNETPLRASVDRFGWLTLVAAQRGPVQSVQAISIRYAADNVWTALSWNATDNLILPPADTSGPPRAGGFTVRVKPDSGIRYFPDSDFMVRWSYTGGYATTPERLKAVIGRLALWKYKLREAPLGRVSVPAMGITEMIPAVPDDIRADIRVWTPQDGF